MHEMKKDQFAIELIVLENEKLEDRLSKVVAFIIGTYGRLDINVLDIEATGVLGSEFSDRLENEGLANISKNELFDIFQEDGQIIELNLILMTVDSKFRIIIRDGAHLNVVSNSFSILDKPEIGKYKYFDLMLLNEEDSFK